MEVRELSIIIGMNSAIHMQMVVNERFFIIENRTIIMHSVMKKLPTRTEKRNIWFINTLCALLAYEPHSPHLFTVAHSAI